MDVIIWNSGAYYHGYRPILRSLGAYKAGHSLRLNGYAVQVIDFVNHLSYEQLYNATKKFITGKTLCLAVSTTFLCQLDHVWPNGQHSKLPYHVYQVLEQIKAERPFLKIVLGGYNSDSIPSYNIIDSHISGYAEDIFFELVRYYRTNKNEPIFSIDKNHQRKAYTAARQVTYNIKQDKHKFIDSDCIMPGESLPLEISRGCIFKCKFCNHLLLGRRKDEYLRDMELVKEELEYNYSKWQTTNYFITCDTFNDNQDKMSSWYHMIKSLNFKVNFVSYLRADLLHRFSDTAHLLQETGLQCAFHGIETLNQHAAKAIGKSWSGTHARDYIPKLYHDIWQEKVYQHLNFIVGLPKESKESILSTAKWFVDNDLYHIEFDPLGINRTWSIGTSEFSRNYLEHGYKFKEDSSFEWFNEYWSYSEMKHWHQTVLRPYILPWKRWFGAWHIIGLKTLGYQDYIFDKKYQTSEKYVSALEDVNKCSQQWIQQYYQKLLNL